MLLLKHKKVLISYHLALFGYAGLIKIREQSWYFKKVFDLESVSWYPVAEEWII